MEKISSDTLNKTAEFSQGKNILLVITGGIAAYKAADLASSLKKRGYSVRCILTENAKKFITPLTFETITGKPIAGSLFEGFSTEHIDWARWPDLVVVVPATSNFISKLNAGICDDFALTVLAATRAPVVIAPAMNTAMWENPILQKNIQTLKELHYSFIEPQSEGILACGEEGAGKLATTEKISRWVEHYFAVKSIFPKWDAHQLNGKNILVTAGPTIGPIDAVRYMTNPATGRMGIAISEALSFLGANVFLVLGKDKGTDIPLLDNSVTVIPVLTAKQMRLACEKIMEKTKIDAVFASAAVLDFEVKNPFEQKQKRSQLESRTLTLELEHAVDVLASIQEFSNRQNYETRFIGFAAETQNLLEYATDKMRKKNLDFLFVNRVSPQTIGTPAVSGFGSSTNAGYLLSQSKTPVEIELQSKESLAYVLIKNTLC